MELIIFSDPHLGCNRKANTTIASRKRLKKELYYMVAGVIATASEGRASKKLICTGDFFDTFSNDEADLLEGLTLARDIDLILAGNHDVVNDSSRKGSLDVVSEVLQGSCVVPMTAVGKRGVHIDTTSAENTSIVVIPHHSSQNLFEESLQEAYEIAEDSDREYKLLFLHCNYNYPEERLNETTLNLTKEDSMVLLDAFDYVLSGHEHTPADHHAGRLLMVGSVFPTSFGDISNKRILKFDTSTGTMSSIQVWNKAEGYETISAEALMEPGEIEIPATCRFIDVTGSLSAADVGAFTRAVQTKLWGNPTGGRLIGVRNHTTLLRDISDVAEAWGEEGKIPLPEKLGKALEGTEYYPLWERLLAESKKEDTRND